MSDESSREADSLGTSPTILDVATRAGVSVGTVSNVLNGAIKVSDARKNRVLAAIHELGYSRNVLAQGLRRRRSNVIGLCVPSASVTYLATLADKFEKIAQDGGFELMHIFSHQDGSTELRRIRTLLNLRPAGILLLPSADPEATLSLIYQSGVPAVILDRPLDDPRFDQVSVNARLAAEAVMQGLIDLGHRSILFVLKSRTLLVTRHRIEGMKRAVKKSQVEVDLQLLCVVENDAKEQFRAALFGDDPVTAIIASNGANAAWVVQLLNEMGIRCPDDVSLVTTDEPDWAELVRPTLSVVRQPATELTTQAWELLSARMEGNNSQPRRIRLDPEVHFAGSVGAPKQRLPKPASKRPAASQRNKGGALGQGRRH